jgi:hypothetical protein
MPKYAEPVLRIVCLILAIVLLWQLGALASRRDPLAGVRVPSVQTSLKPSPAVSSSAPGKPIARGNMAPTNTVPSEVQARIDRIADSGILGPVPKPVVMPVALLGIAGRDVFLRTPNGQTGLLRAGEELGGIKLLQIGTNRVVVLQDGQQKELTMFSGFGSPPLLSKEKENPK